MTQAGPLEDAFLHDAAVTAIPGLIWAFQFDDAGHAEALDVDAPLTLGRQRVWLHFNLTDTRAKKWIDDAELPDTARSVLAGRATHQQVHAAQDCIFGVISDLERGFDTTDDSVAHLYFAMTEHMLISGRHHAVTGAAKARDVLDTGRLRIGSVAGLFELIVENLAEGVDRFIDQLNDQLDAVEEVLSRDERPEKRHVLGRIRRTCVKVTREVSGLRLIFQRMDADAIGQLPHPMRIATAKLAQRLEAIARELLEVRERARLLQEEINTATAEESNRALGLLSVITAVFLPPTLVTGMFGMNVKGLPWADDPNGFLWVCGTMVASVVAVLAVLRRVNVLRF